MINTFKYHEQYLISKLKKSGAQSVKIIECDLISRDGVLSLTEKLKTDEIDILFNNAGLLTGGLLEDQSLDDIYNMF